MSHPFRRAAAVTAATAVAAGALLLAPLPAHADADEVLLITLDAADAAAASDLDVVESGDAGVVVLGDAATQELLADRGAEPVEVDTYAESIVAPAASASHFSVAAAAAAEHPLPERLADEQYETFFGGYRTVEAYEEFAHDIADAYPEIAELVDFGDSWLKTQGRGGHDLLAVRLTADVSEQPEPTDGQEGRPRFVLVAQAHAREIITSELAWRYATELLDGYGTDPQVTALLDSTEVWINFQANPDGIDLVEEALETSPVNASGDATPPNSSTAWQRKNVNDSLFAPTSSNWNSQQPGIDMNRNFGFHWGEASSSTNPNSTTYRGTAPHSEPEVAAASALLTDLFGVHAAENANPAPADRTGTYVNLHSYADYVIYPYAYSAADDVPNLAAIKANAFRQSYVSGFATGKAGEILYDNSGNDIDWIYSQLGVPAYTYEIGTARTGGFFPAYTRVPGFFDSVAPGIRFAAEASYAPYTAALGGLVEEVEVDRVEGGAVQVSGVAGDERYGTHAGSQQRRPAVTDIVAVEAALAADRNSIDETVALELDGQGTTVGFTGVIPVTAETAEDRAVFVRAKNGSGEWGPWRAATVPLEPTTTAVSSQGRALTATVTPEVAGPLAVTGTVQFALNGEPVGEPVPVRHGVARIAIPAHLGTGEVTATYGGDGYHDGSTGLSRLGRN